MYTEHREVEMDARVEIAAAAARPVVRSRGPDYLGLLNDCLSAWNFAGAVLSLSLIHI